MNSRTCLLVALTLTVLGGCLATPTTKTTLPRPDPPAHVDVRLAASKRLERITGGYVVEPRDMTDEVILRAFVADGVTVYVVEAERLDEWLLRRRAHLRQLHGAPWWEGDAPAWLREE